MQGYYGNGGKKRVTPPDRARKNSRGIVLCAAILFAVAQFFPAWPSPAIAADMTVTGGNGINGGGGTDAASGANGTPGADRTPAASDSGTLDGSYGDLTLTGGNGGAGGRGGDGDNGNTGGRGGHGGDGGSGSASVLSASPITINGDVHLTAGSGGRGGNGGSNNGGTGGRGGNGGRGGGVGFATLYDVLMYGHAIGVVSGLNGLNGAFPGGTGGIGGQAVFQIDGTLRSFTDLNINLTRQGGILRFGLGRLDVTEGNAVNMTFAGVIQATDSVSIGTLLLNKGAGFTTNGAAGGAAGVGGATYTVGNLDVFKDTAWNSGGIYAPSTAANDYMRFDMADISPGHTLLTAGGGLTVNLTGFDPAAQHLAYLTDPNTPRYMDDPRYNRGPSLAPAFITSPYQTKRLRLDGVTLIAGSAGSIINAAGTLDADGNVHYDGSAADDFGCTAGLRRYYWDVCVDSGGGALIAHNNYTADASRVLLQGTASSLANIDLSFLSSTYPALRQSAALLEPGKFGVDAVIGGGHVRIDTGSHVTLDGYSVAITAARKIATSRGGVTVGLFGEYGSSNYDTYSAIHRYGEVWGGGSADNLGGGLFFEAKLGPRTAVEGSARAGRAKTKFELTRDPYLMNPRVHSYSASAGYQGAHLGISHSIPLSERTDLKVYALGRWANMNSDDFVTAFGDPVHVDGLESLRARLGIRVTRASKNKKVTAYLGAAWEHEFKGETSGRLGLDGIVNPPSIQGSSLYGEAGLSVKLSESADLNVGVYGYTGRQEGYGGRLGLKIRF